jgi:fumarate hydratase class I
LRAGRAEGTCGGWKVVAAGPTTHSRGALSAQIIRDFGLRGVIGKGGGRSTAACREYGCVSAAVGGAQVLAERILRVPNVYLLRNSAPEAIWELEVERFPAVVTIDAQGGRCIGGVRRHGGVG